MKTPSKTRMFSTLSTDRCAARTGTPAPRSPDLPRHAHPSGAPRAPLPVRRAHPIQSLYDSLKIRESVTPRKKPSGCRSMQINLSDQTQPQQPYQKHLVRKPL